MAMKKTRPKPKEAIKKIPVKQKESWPDFTKKDLVDAVEDFGRRNRRYGAV